VKPPARPSRRWRESGGSENSPIPRIVNGGPPAVREFAAMKPRKTGSEIQRLDETRYAVVVDGLVRYVGTLEECQRRATILLPQNDRAAQDRALGRLGRSGG
jgi:hypothetical protein